MNNKMDKLWHTHTTESSIIKRNELVMPIRMSLKNILRKEKESEIVIFGYMNSRTGKTFYTDRNQSDAWQGGRVKEGWKLTRKEH